MRKLLVAATLSLLATACSTPSPWEQTYGPNFPQARPGEAALYIVRDTASEGAPPIGVTIGRNGGATLTSLTWIRLDLPPKLYDLRAYGPQASTELIVTVDPGQTRFLEAQEVAPGNAQLLEISQADGRRIVRQGQQVPTYR